MLTDEKLKEWQDAARRDDACTFFVPSDIRVMLGEIARLRAAQFDWVPIAKALFEIEHDERIADQAWFDFQGKAQRIVAAMRNQ